LIEARRRERRKPLSIQDLGLKVYALRTDEGFDRASKRGYNGGMKKGKISDCNGDTWHHEEEDSDGLTIWAAWRVTFNGHQRNLSWHTSEEDAKAFISAGIAQAQRSKDELDALIRDDYEQTQANMLSDYEQAQADMAELRGPRGWV
jgi:hypothetical protein